MNNSEGYENGETDYVIPYDDTIYYAHPPPEAVFTDPATGQVYYGHCSSTGEYYDAYPVSPVMVAAGYPPVYYPMVPYAPMDWTGVPAPMYPMIAAPPPPLPQMEDPSLLSPGLQGLESSPATTTNPNTNSDTTSSSSATAAGAVATTTIAATPSTTSTPATSSTTAPTTLPALAEGANADSVVSNKAIIGSDSGIDSGSSVGDETSAAASQGSCSGAEEECGGGPKSNKQRQVVADDQPNPRPKQTQNKNDTGGATSLSDAKGQEPSLRAKGCIIVDKSHQEDNNNQGGKEQYEIVKGVEKLNLISKDKDEFSSSESVLSSSASSSGKASPPTIVSPPHCNSSKSQGIEEHSAQQDTPAKTMEIDASNLTYATLNNGIVSGPGVVKNITATVISSQHPHLATTALAYPAAGPHPQAIPVGAAPAVMTTVPIPVGCPPVMIAATPTGMPLPPLVPATPMHPMSHPPPPPPGGPGHHQHHHNNHHHVPHNTHNQHHHHLQHHHPQHHPHHQQHHSHAHGPPPHHSNYPHHNHHPRHHGPPHPHHPQHHQPQQQQTHHNSPHHHHQHQQHHHMPPPPPSAQTQAAQTAQIGSAPNIGPPPPGSTPYHVYPHPTAYVYGPPVYNGNEKIFA
ncbi:unnamed protein product [Orchesella dallaii]|uniref:Uncharacterized protein n=1 Tax=Orchesella dallaii TaxID=48710 RepID=A0ABP1QA17_9HEXA